MNNNLPQKYEESFFKRIFKNIKNFFINKAIEKNEIEKFENKINTPKKNIYNNKANFFKESDFKLKEDIKSIVESNHKLLQTLPYERLKQLDSLYDEEIEKNNKEIEYLDYQLKKIRV